MRIDNMVCIVCQRSLAGAAAVILTPETINNPDLQPFTSGDIDPR